MPIHAVIPVSEASQIGEARRVAARRAEAAGLNETDRGRVAIVATELATNLVRHAKGGRMLVRAAPANREGGASVEILSLDVGPGMSDVARCLRDGFSTGGTAGNGLGAIRRLSDEFDLYTAASGTVIVSRIGKGPRGPVAKAPALRWGVVAVPAPGEEACGDGWQFAGGEDASAVMVADGLGHGPEAAKASEAAGRVFGDDPFRDPKTLLETAHRAMSGTRGAAVAVARLDPASGTLRYAGVGNISGSILLDGASRGLFSHNGTVGHQVRKVQEFEYPWAPGSLLVLHSDGLQTRWDLGKFPGLVGRHPAVIAGVLFRDFCRGRDDVTVLVVGLSRSQAGS